MKTSTVISLTCLFSMGCTEDDIPRPAHPVRMLLPAKKSDWVQSAPVTIPKEARVDLDWSRPVIVLTPESAHGLYEEQN